MSTAEIIQLKPLSEFVCSACGSDRHCNCNAPALERLAAIKEQGRQRKRAHDERKREENQRGSNVTKEPAEPQRIFGGGDAPKYPHDMPTEAEAEESYQETLYDQSCRFVEVMNRSTRQRFFAHLRRKYPND